MMVVGRGSCPIRNPKDTIDYTFVPTPKEETQTVNLTYTVTPIRQSGDGFPDERSLAPFGNSPADKIGYARSSSDAGDGAVDTGAVNGAFVTTGSTKTTFGQDTRTLDYYSGSYVYPDRRAAGYYIQYAVYTAQSGSFTRHTAPTRAIAIESARFVDNSSYTVNIDTIDGIKQYRGTNSSYIELTWKCEVLTFYDADGNVVSESGNWVTYSVDYTTSTTRMSQYSSVLMKSQTMNGAAARQGRAFQVTETETVVPDE